MLDRVLSTSKCVEIYRSRVHIAHRAQKNSGVFRGASKYTGGLELDHLKAGKYGERHIENGADDSIGSAVGGPSETSVCLDTRAPQGIKTKLQMWRRPVLRSPAASLD